MATASIIALLDQTLKKYGSALDGRKGGWVEALAVWFRQLSWALNDN
jgi:hypothetical protein